MTNDTRERARQVAHGIVESLCHDYRMDGGGDHGPTCDRITDALANAARNERIRWADRVEALAKEYAGGTNTMDLLDGAGRGGAASALLRLAAELRAEGGGS